jgi:hypothetical protein
MVEAAFIVPRTRLLYHYEGLDIALLVLEEVRPGTTQ